MNFMLAEPRLSSGVNEHQRAALALKDHAHRDNRKEKIEKSKTMLTAVNKGQKATDAVLTYIQSQGSQVLDVRGYRGEVTRKLEGINVENE